MAITIKPALRKNPQDKAAAAKYYAQVVLAPEMKQKQIVDQIADRCTLTGSDIKAVLDALMVVIKRNLANGSPVRLGDLGSFRPSVSGKGTEDASKCGASSVKKARVIYVTLPPAFPVAAPATAPTPLPVLLAALFIFRLMLPIPPA